MLPNQLSLYHSKELDSQAGCARVNCPATRPLAGRAETDVQKRRRDSLSTIPPTTESNSLQRPKLQAPRPCVAAYRSRCVESSVRPYTATGGRPLATGTQVLPPDGRLSTLKSVEKKRLPVTQS